MKSLIVLISLMATSLAFAGEVNEPTYVGHISCALENSKDNSFSMSYAPLRTNGQYVQAEVKAELKGYTCWGLGFYNDQANVAGMNETKVTFPSGQKMSQMVLNSYASRMVLDDKMTCSCQVQIVADQHPRMTEYCRSAAEGSVPGAKGSKILSTKITGSNLHTETYEVRAKTSTAKTYFKVVVSGKPFGKCSLKSLTEIKK